MKSIEEFTNLYSLQKTLKFELKPIGKDGKPLSAEDAKKMLSKILEEDKKIKRAYTALKPVMDQIHENVITDSLKSNDAKKIDFSVYYKEYKKGKEKNLDEIEKSLRETIGKIFEKTGTHFAEKAGKDEKDKVLLKNKGIKCLTEAGILKFLEKEIDKLVPDENQRKEFLDTREFTDSKGKKQTERTGHLDTFRGFFGYFSGYNQNRENYYVTNKEASTAIATRIIHENLPKFCDNILQYSEEKIVKNRKTNEIETLPSRKSEYKNAYQYLKDTNRDTKIKDAETNKIIEAAPIEEKIFNIKYFSECLAQSGIEEYNRVIGHYNLLINLYNQARGKETNFQKLSLFKTLYKQIGCGKNKTLFYEIKYDTIEQQQKAGETTLEPLSLQGLLELIGKAGEKYFPVVADKHELSTISKFIKWLKENESWEGVYWSKSAVDKVSNKYLANWHDIKDRIQYILENGDKEQKENLKPVASFKKDREDQLIIHDAVELSGLFDMLNQDRVEGWSKRLFKESILENRSHLIVEKLLPSENLINLICAEIQDLASSFLEQSESIAKLSDYKNESKILRIKDWLDNAKSVLWILKYFDVRESKVKGASINPELNNILSKLLHAEDADWFGWYDAVRNYLTKKPQDDAKKNKLKLNFGNSNFLNGFVDSHSDSDNATQYGGYLLRKKSNSEFVYFLGISKNAKLFRCHLQNEIKDTDKSEFERLEYYQAKSTTYFYNNYSQNKEKLIYAIEESLESFVSKNLDLKDQSDLIRKRDKNDQITPTTLIERIKKNVNFESILTSKKILNLIEITIRDLKNSCEIFKERAPNLVIIQQKEYSGVSGLKQIIDDLQKIAKENKVFNFFKISNTELKNSFEDQEKVFYLFQISNKDLSLKDQKNYLKGTENLHTLFFRALMREYNEVATIDLGSGEVFFRDAAITEKQIHLVGEKMINKKAKDSGNTIPEKTYRELFLLANGRIKVEDCKEIKSYLTEFNKIDESKVTIKEVKHEIIKDKRFTESKYQLHLSISLNFNAFKNDITDLVNNHFTQAEDIQFLGIDRGEKHLIYYSLLNINGEIQKQGDFDVINKKDYLKEINDAAKLRRQKQENWQQKGNISNLKDGYISLVIHEIIEMMKDENGKFKPTFIVLEDLNSGFKRGRQKFEQQVYQKFELALAKKLNFVVDKRASMGEIGSVQKALQLTPPIMNYQDIENRKQIGIMLYTRANYTSVTDPVTGWRKTIYLKTGSEEFIKEKILEAFTEISVDVHGDYSFQYKDRNIEKVWTLWSSKNGKCLERYRAKRGKDKNEYIVESKDVKKMLDRLFKDFDKSKSLKEQIRSGKKLQKIEEEKHTAWESLRFAIDLIQQIRNSGDKNENQDDNFLLSPIRNELGEHFDSRIFEKKENPKLPKDADANGAYNIARKGIIMYEHIKQWIANGKEKADLDLFISDEEWDLWGVDRQQWTQKLKKFASRKANKKNSNNST